ncbi:MAG: MauE/DoxX family redox-associated membrane protein, partial [Sciscionella sp.]
MIGPAPKLLDAFGMLLRLGLAAVWLVAGVPKLGEINQNYLAVRAYELFPDSASRIIGGVQPFVEIALGVLLLLGIGVRLVSMISAVILLVYIAGIVQAWVRGLSIDCGCFSSGGQVAAGDTRY